MKILLADNSEVFTTALKNQLDRVHDVRTCHDGVAAAQMLFDECPDLLLLNMGLPGLDGFTILQNLRDSGRNIPVIALTPQMSNFERNWLCSLQVDSVLLTPCTVCQTMLRILAVMDRGSNCEKSNMETVAKRMLLSLGLRMNLVGFDYVENSLELLAVNPNLALTKELYPAVATCFNVSSQSVERSMRTVIRDAWNRRNEAVWRLYFPSGVDGSIPCPNNSTFLVRMARCLTDIEKKTG